MKIVDRVYKAAELILNKFYIPIQEGKRTVIINVILFYTVFCTWVGNTIVEVQGTVIYISSCLSIFILCMFLNDGVIRKPKASKLFGLFFLMFLTTFMVAAIVTRRLGSILLCGTYLIAFPTITLLVSDNEKRKHLINSLFNAIIVNFYIVLLLSLIIIDATEQKQYSGVIINPNSLGLFAFVTVAALTYKIYMHRKAVYYMAMGIPLAAILFTQSRTALICVLVCIIVLLAFIIKEKRYEFIKFKNVICAALGCAVLFYAVFYIAPFSDSIHDYVMENWVKEDVKNEIANIDIEDRQFDRLTAQMGEGKDFSTGRLAIWEAYIRGIRIAPNGDDVTPIVNGEKLTLSAHNTYIHLSYCFGLFCGIFYLLLNITIGILSIKLLKNRKKNILLIFNFILVLSYGMTTLIETSYNFVSYVICLVYWLFTFAVTLPEIGYGE